MLEPQKPSIVIGITGGIGSGKTTVTRIIESYGYKVIYTDVLARDIANTDPRVKEKIIEIFGSEAYTADKLFNAKYISEIVFSFDDNGQHLDLLNSIIHPIVIDKMSSLVEMYEEQGEKLIFVESALIYEYNLEKGFDYILVVNADEETRISRAMKRSQENRNIIKQKNNLQMASDEKVQLADFVIENNGDENQLIESVNFFLNIFKELSN